MSNWQLQRIFEVENTSFSSGVRDRRLYAAAARLRRGRNGATHSNFGNGLLSGFRDLSNVNRGLKSRFAMAPRDTSKRLPRHKQDIPNRPEI